MATEADSDRTIAEMLGKALMAFSVLEAALAFDVSELLFGNASHEDEGRILGENMSFRSKVQVFRLLFNRRFPDPDHPEQLRQLIKDLEAANTHRNRLVHDEWLGTGDTSHATTFRLMKKGDPHGKGWITTVSADDLAASVKTFEKANQSLTHFMLVWGNDIRASIGPMGE